jgi:hypothetical protein
MASASISTARSAAAVSVVKYGFPVPAADERLTDDVHADGGHEPRDHSLVLEGALECKGVDDGPEHPHVVPGDLVDAAPGVRHAPEDVARADDDADLDPEVLHRLDLARIPPQHGGIDPELLLSHERFAAQFQEDA